MSNTIGSNVFDILVGLGVPWALQTMCVDYGSVVRKPVLPASPHKGIRTFTDPGPCFWSVAGDDKQPWSVVLGGAPAGLRGPHGERHFIELRRSSGNFQRCNFARVRVWLHSSPLLLRYVTGTKHGYISASSES